MRILKCYYKGIKEATFQPKMVFLLWIFNLMLGLIVFFQAFRILSRVIGSNLTADQLLKKFDFNFFFELLAYQGESIRSVFSMIFILFFIYFLVSIFLSGGILFTLTHPRKLNYFENNKESFAQVFFQGGGKFFGRFFRLAIYSLILWIALIGIYFLMSFLSKVLTNHGANEQLAYYLFWVRIGVGLFLIFLIKMILDYTRIKIVNENCRKVFSSLLKIIKFVFKKLAQTLALYYSLLFAGLILFGIYFALKQLIPVDSLVTIVVLLFIQQIFIASRGWLKIAFLAAQLRFYSSDHSLNSKIF
ncbi:MAG: hypothetical protein ACE5WD_04845 [Candidatus Aminicenantia bacterium]